MTVSSPPSTEPTGPGSRRAAPGATAQRMSAWYEAELTVPAAARRFAETAADLLNCHIEHDDLRLLVSELVTNAVELGEGRIELALSPCDDGGVRVEVRDEGYGAPEIRDPGPDDLNGRGLRIVDRVSRRWGVDQFLPGKIVWFELAPST